MPTSSPRHVVSSDSGQSTLELVFCLPLFLVLVLGTAEIGNLAWAAVQVNNAARAAAAYASQSRANASPLNPYILTAAQNEAPKLTNLQVTSTQVCYCVSSGTPGPPDPGCSNTNTQPGNCSSPNVIQVAVQINTSATVTPFVHYPGLPASYTMHGQATMGVEQ